MGHAELAAATNFSFLRGASHPHEMVARAAELGLSALGVADRNTLAGVVRAHVAAKEAGLALLVGARLVPEEGPEILCYPTDRAAYGRLSALLSAGKRAASKGECHLSLEAIRAAGAGQVLIVVAPRGDEAGFADALARLAAAWPGQVFTGIAHHLRGGERARIARLADLGARSGAPAVAIGDALYHIPNRRPLQDVLTCIRAGTTVEGAGLRLEPNAERHLKPPEEIGRLFAGFEPLLERARGIAARIAFSLDDLAYAYPEEPVPPGMTAQAHLEALTWAGAARRYPAGVPARVAGALTRELALIDELGYAPYFLTVHDIVAWARGQGILCQGRGSAANSAVCYCLHVTAVDPEKSALLFERFISRERREPPDIDVDFEHERREEVIQHVYARYGRDRAALTATVICYRPRSAVREVCKALGLSEDIGAALAGTVWGSWGREIEEDHIRQAGLDPANPAIRRAVILTRQLIGFPRHLSQHVGGFVLTRTALTETVPIGNAAMAERTFIEWDKDDIAALGLMKVDVLALGMLSCVRKAFELIAAHGGPRLTLASLPQEDGATYAMLSRADSLGVFQVESRAQMNMLPRMRPATFYDLVIEVAIVRPGPIQGEMVHPYLRRRQGREGVVYPAPAPEHGDRDELRRILGRTLGVPLFQEQAMQIAIDAARFTPEEANGLRRAMATFRKVGTIQHYQDKMVSRMIARGYDPDFAARCFDQIKGFGEYGFPESHAASFALLVYVSAWLKCHHPAAFACALLNSQPMGFYAPAQIVRDARAHGVEVRGADVNHSARDCTLEAGEGALALRLGLGMVEGLGEAEAQALVAGRGAGYGDPAAIRRAGVSRAALETLAAADAFRSLGLDRRGALWAVRGMAAAAPLPLFAAAGVAETGAEPAAALPEMPLGEHVVQDYRMLGLSLKAHPVALLRAHLDRLGVVSTAAAGAAAHGRRVHTAGVVLVRQKPGSANGVIFVTIEDETGIANLVIWRRVAARFRAAVMGARLVRVTARVQRAEGVTHLVVERMEDRSGDLALLSEDAQRAMGDKGIARADEVLSPVAAGRPGHGPPAHPRAVRVMPKSRDFH